MFCDDLISHPQIFKDREIVAQGIANAHKFVLTDAFVRQTLDQKSDELLKISGLVKLPFETVWLERNASLLDKMSALSKIGYFCIQDPDKNSDRIMIYHFIKLKDNQGFGGGYHFAFSPSSIEHHEIKGIKFRDILIHYWKDLSEEDKKTVDGYAMNSAWDIMDYFSRINSPQVTDLSNKCDLGKLNKKRMQNGLSPLYEYHVVDLSKKVKNCLKKSAEQEGNKKLHWRRGHFKVRKTGVFWWSPHLAGHAELGFIEKEYAA